MSSINPFDFVTAVSETKQDIMRDENHPAMERDYVPFMVNTAMSYFPDSILYANELNMRWQAMTNRAQFLFYLNTLRPRKRYSKWAKSKKDENIALVVAYYECSQDKAREYLELLSEEQIEQIRERIVTGVE